MDKRYEWLLRQHIRCEEGQKLKREQRLAGAEVSTSTVAVLPLAYQDQDEQLAPLRRGFSEMISADTEVPEADQFQKRIHVAIPMNCCSYLLPK